MRYLKSDLITEKITFKNRLIYPPMATNAADEQGRITKKHLTNYREKAEGGFLSMIITEHCYITKRGQAVKGQISAAEDEMITGLSSLAEVIHKNGSKAAAQINHAGSLAIYGEDNVAPSRIHDEGRIRKGKNFIAGHVLSKKEIKNIVKEFADASIRVKKAGFDAVEIHGAHGYLLNEFYSPLSNHREDEYGGSLQNRIRFHLEVIRAVREAVGENYPIFLRLGAVDDMEGGSTLEDALEASRKFEKAGVDLLDISGGLTGYEIKGREKEQGYFKEITEAVKEAVSLPVILTGGITTAEAAEGLLSEKRADLIGVGRAIFRNSAWTKCMADED